MTDREIDRRAAVRRLGGVAAGLVLPAYLGGCGDPPRAEDSEIALEELNDSEPPSESAPSPEDEARLHEWVEVLRREGVAAASVPFGVTTVRVGELALGTPYEAFTLEQYIHAGGSPMRTEPLTLSLTRFDCVSLVESCLAIARVARREASAPAWSDYAREMERMRYRGGTRAGYSSRLHYFSEWLTDNERRGLVRDLGGEIGAVEDRRPLRFMTSNPDSYPAMAFPEVREEIAAAERALDGSPRSVVPRAAIPQALPRIETGDILAFATSIEGLDVTHAAFAHVGTDGVKRVLHAPLSGGVVEITRTTIPEYVAAIRQATGILVARPLQGPPE